MTFMRKFVDMVTTARVILRRNILRRSWWALLLLITLLLKPIAAKPTNFLPPHGPTPKFHHTV